IALDKRQVNAAIFDKIGIKGDVEETGIFSSKHSARRALQERAKRAGLTNDAHARVLFGYED
ncbi:MAG: hypothetical protein ABL996_23900, partial [Micropepsaceae bacterium]